MYPDDPQGQHGLDNCMNMLERISIIWPSAWRANEILTGVKAYLDRWFNLPSSLRRIVSHPRSKRAAEDPDYINTMMVIERSTAVPSHIYRESDSAPHGPVYQARGRTRSQNQGPSDHKPSLPSNAQQAQAQRYSHMLDIPSQSIGGSGAYIAPSSYDCWAADSSSPSASLSKPMSISMLLQTHITGLVDEHGASCTEHAGQSQRPRYGDNSGVDIQHTC